MHSNILFKEIMKVLPRWKFEDMVKKHGSDRYSKEFSSWDHLLTMVYSQISGNNSLRDVESAFNSQIRHHYHLGTGEVKKSTLSYANKHRKTEVFREVLEFLNNQLVSGARKNLREILKILDSTCIYLVPEIYPGVGKSNGRMNGVKLHVEYCSNDNSISRNTITTANINDIEEAKKFIICEGATYVFDRGYMDLAWWQELHGKKCRFVSRIQKHMPYKIVEERIVKGENIEQDQVIKLSSKKAKQKIVINLRLIKVKIEGGKTIEIVSNDTLSPAAEIAGIYKQRWEIEVLFKWLKQNLKIKRFMGTSENAIHIQIITALIAYVMVALYRKQQKPGDSMHQCLIYIRQKLFESPNLNERYRQRTEKQKLINNLQMRLV